MVLGLALSIGLLPQYAPTASADGGLTRPKSQTDLDDPVRGKNATPETFKKTDQAEKAAVKKTRKAHWPGVGSTEVELAGKAVKAKGLPLTAKAAGGTKGADSVRLEMLGRKATEAAGVDGVLFTVARTDGDAASGPAQVALDYSDFADAFGGSYSSRLRLATYPACVLTTPEKKACSTPTYLKTSNDRARQTLTATVQAAGDISGPSSQLLGAATADSSASAATVVAATAGGSGDGGSYKATSLAQSSQWGVDTSSGAFTWSYPMNVPPVPGGLQPTVGLSYNSQSIDGQTATTNNQGSWIGQGFSYEPGYIERSYKSCADDGHADTNGDECWAFDNATISLTGGSSGRLVKDKSGEWRISSDDNSKVEHLTGTTNGDDNGEYWKITTADGTQYWFGLNRLTGYASGNEETGSTWTVPVYGDDSGEPCYNATFANAYCTQAWRWNLDYVVDPHGNALSYFYGTETNYYTQGLKTTENGKPYIRGGYLKRIDYGQRDKQVYTTKPAAQVVFTTAERCVGSLTDCSASALTDATAADWPDVPWDQNCKSGTKCPGQNSPTFWTRKKLTKITTQIRTGDSTYTPVDEWRLAHIFTDNGDASKSLWLNKIDHTGKVGTDASVPSVELNGTQLPNRVDESGDNLLPFYRYRLSSVLNESGGALSVNYADNQCTASTVPDEDSSVKRCFPVKWNPPGVTDPITDWFHKYVVGSVVQTDLTGDNADQVTSYTYVGDAGWRKTPADGISKSEYRTWSDWRGYGKVQVVTSAGTNSASNTKTEHVYFRGLDGDVNKAGANRSVKVTDSTGGSYDDSDWKAGQELETITYDGDVVTEKSVTVPWTAVTATEVRDWATYQARYVATGSVDTYTALAAGGWRHIKSSTTFDSSTGRAKMVDDDGEVGVADNQCTRTEYADSASAHIYSLVSRVEKVAVDCASTPNRAKDVIADDLTYYDGSATLGAAPTKGDPTTTKRLQSHNGTTATYQTTAVTNYDDYGRPKVVKDAETASSQTQYTSSTVYTDTYGLATKAVVTNIDGWTTSTEYAPAWGQPTAKVDLNGLRTDLAYDGFGRLISVWMPDRPKANNFTPSIKYEYLIRGDDGPAAVHTQKIENDGTTYGSEWSLYDGWLRPRQEQTEGEGGRMVADTVYDGSGRVAQVNDTYFTTEAPASDLFDPVDAELPSQTVTTYDGASRTTASIFKVKGTEKYRTTYTYGGDRVTTTPPKGGDRTTAVKDGRDRTTTQIQYPADGAAVTTSYGYNAAGQLTRVTDDKGNNWTYTYDQLGRKETASDPDAGASSYTYDLLDRQTSVTVNGDKTSTVYDELGRVASTWQGEPTTGTKLSVSKYDTAYKGELYGVYTYKDGAVYSSVTYPTLDPNNDYAPVSTKYFLSKTAEPQLGGSYEFGVEYDRDGAVGKQTLPAIADLPGESLANVYDALRRPVGLNTSLGGLSYVTDASYSPTSNLETLELYTGEPTAKKTWINNNYEAGTNRLTNSSVRVEGASAVAYDADYTYDAAGDILSIADTPSGGTSDVQCFAYDGLGRVSSAWTSSVASNGAKGTGSTDTSCAPGASASTVGGVAPYWTDYGYDTLGNRTGETRHGLNGTATSTRTYKYGETGSGPNGAASGPHTVSSVTQQTAATSTTPQVTSRDTYVYDASGNTNKRVLDGDTQSLTWDKQGELTQVTNADSTVTTYKYDASGARILRDTPTEKTFYLPGTELHYDKATAKVTATRYYTFAGTTVAMREADGVHFLASDHQGTAELAVDAKTGTINRRRMDAFGNARDESTSSGSGWVNDKGFVGGTVQKSTGLTTLGAREYDSDTGRFISADPIIDYTDPQQINGYAYANNSPVSNSDASGLRLAECVGGWNQCGPGPKKHSGAVDSDGDGRADPGVRNSTYTEAQAKADIARGAEDSAKQKAIAIAKELGKIAADELGITDALDCFTTGNLAACGNTALNVVSSFLGGGPLAKLAKKYLFRWDKAAALAKRVVGLGDDLLDTFDEWRKSRKEAKRLTELAGASCPVKKPNSFTSDTKVLMADGSTKKIKDVKIGELVVATDPETGASAVEEVAAEIKGSGLKNLVKITLDADGDRGNRTASITATDEHPIWVAGMDAWVNATDLQANEWLQTGEGDWVRIESVKRWNEVVTVYNITVTDLHTYLVASDAGDILVHNARPKRQRPHPDAEGPHTTFMRDGATGEIKKYATWVQNTNPQDPRPFDLAKRFDRYGPAHTNADGTVVETPHINKADGEARPLDDWEKPSGCP